MWDPPRADNTTLRRRGVRRLPKNRSVMLVDPRPQTRPACDACFASHTRLAAWRTGRRVLTAQRALVAITTGGERICSRAPGQAHIAVPRRGVLPIGWDRRGRVLTGDAECPRALSLMPGAVKCQRSPPYGCGHRDHADVNLTRPSGGAGTPRICRKSAPHSFATAAATQARHPPLGKPSVHVRDDVKAWIPISSHWPAVWDG
jgi:hypothetical protein